MDIFCNIFNIKAKNSTNRIYYLDFVRGLLILLVLYHHAGAPFSGFVLQFHMPALFVLSGYTEFLLNKQKSFSAYVKSKFFRLIIPYLSFELINLIFFILMFGNDGFTFSDAFISIITCINNSYTGLYGRLWFLPAIFVVSIFSYFIKLIAKNNAYITLLFAVLMFALSYISSAIIPYRLPFTIDIAFLGTTFFLLGHIFGNTIKYILESKTQWPDLLCFLFWSVIFIICNKIANPTCYMYINEYIDFPFMIICAISGTVISFIIAKYIFLWFNKITFFKNIILWYSINSLAVFPIHLSIKVLSIPLLSKFGIDNWVCLFLIMFVLTIPIVNAINTYFPFILGTFNFKKLKKT